MSIFSQEYHSVTARLRVDINSDKPRDSVLDEMTFLNYRLASVEVHNAITLPQADILWNEEAAVKDIRYDGRLLTLDGEWFQGELQKIIVTMLALRLDEEGYHPFHASGVRYRGKTIMFMGGEANHGKTMSQIEGCRRGGLVVSTETLVIDGRGWVVTGSKNVFLRMRAKGTERSDLPNQDQGVAKFFDKTPEFKNYDEPCNVDLVILPAIDGNYDTSVVQLGQFESEYQAYHSMMNYFGLHQVLASGLAMPIVDTDALRRKRAAFGAAFAAGRPFYLIRAKNPQLVLDEVEKLL